MSSARDDALLATKRRARDRKSIAYMPSPEIASGAMDRENATTTILSGVGADNSKDTRAKRSRSMSIGPGGLEALKEGAGNKRKARLIYLVVQSTLTDALQMPLGPTRSILKPSVKISPLKKIPLRKTPEPANAPESPSRSPSRRATAASPTKVSPTKNPTHAQNSGTADHEERERLEKEEEIRKHREARRKSLAARRVSFAAEATLHTWEDMQDTTASTVSSEPSSKLDAASQDGSSSSNDLDEIHVSRSPAKRTQRKRRSSVVPPLNFNNPEDDVSSSADSDSDDEDIVEADTRNDEIVTSDSDSGDEDLRGETDVMAEQNTGPNVSDPARPDVSFQPNPTSPRASRSPTPDDTGADVSMDLAGDDITAAFKPWAQKLALGTRSLEEKVNPFSPAFKVASYPTLPPAAEVYAEEDDGMSMDMTKAVGVIITASSALAQPQNTQQSAPSRLDRRRSSASSLGGETMEFTTAIGGIQPTSTRSPDHSMIDENEELSMDFTTAFGSIHTRQARQPILQVPDIMMGGTVEDQDTEDEDAGMEMTTALGGILQPAISTELMEEEEDTNMDVTRAFGGILQQSRTNKPVVLEAPDTVPEPTSKLNFRNTSARKARNSVGATATGSPMIMSPSKLWPRDKGYVKQVFTPTKVPKHTDEQAASTSTRLESLRTLTEPASTPEKQITPQGVRPTTPGKTPMSTGVAMRIASPKRLFQAELANSRRNSDQDSSDPLKSKPVFPPKPNNRRISGFGVDKAGLGSPKVAALLDRRASISVQADVFVAQAVTDRNVRFDNPRALYAQAMKERDEDERRESGQFILERESNVELDPKEPTLTLKERIENMTPKKNRLKGRKSLAPGGAKGLLGKRPIELDEEDEDGTPLALKHRSMTPVKKVKLTGPPSKLETIGRQPGSTRKALGTMSANERAVTPSIDSPTKVETARTPKSQGRFKDAEALPSAQKPIPTLGKEVELDDAELNETPDAKEKVHLQDFLNMTSIRFMELNTTKRRHTIAPGSGPNSFMENGEEDQDRLFEEAVVAGACTVPMLELFQHSCRELKSYISEGRDIIREIEVDTYEDNPPLFQEYMSASPAERSVMDTQFKNMKTHARLTSKGMWYEWRMKLLEGLKLGLIQVSEGMTKDDEVLSKQEVALEKTLSPMLQQHENLTNECMELQAKADELPEDEREELEEVRKQLKSADAELQEKKERILGYRKRLEKMQTDSDNFKEAKEECLGAIKEAHKLSKDCRGWSAAQVAVLRAKVTKIEEGTNWAIVTASSTSLTMVYNQHLQLFFNIASFLPVAKTATNLQNTSISLTYVGDTSERHPSPLTTEKRFFLQLMRVHLQCLIQHQTDVKELLGFISTGWSSALSVVNEIRQLDISYVTTCSILSDERLEVKAMMLLPGLKTKVQIAFEVSAMAEAKGIKCRITPKVEVAYGEPFKSNKMADFLKERVVKDVGGGSWARAVDDLKGKLLAQGKK